MSISGYYDDWDFDWDFDWWSHIRWRGQVASAIRGKRGQAFLRELIEALDAMPEKRLIANNLEHAGNVCAIGSVGVKRGVDMSEIDPEDYDRVAAVFGIAHQLVQEIEFMNDEGVYCLTDEERWQKMRAWVVSLLRDEATPNTGAGGEEGR